MRPFDESKRKYDKGGNIIEKLCKKCNKWYDVLHFHKNKQSKDGYISNCKVCQRLVMKKWYEDNQSN